MYENLAADLRKAADEWKSKHPYTPTFETRYDLALKDAADAIEKLSAYTELYKDLAGKNQQMARKLIEEKPRCIPVTERLPSYGDWVLGIGPKKGYYVWMPLPEPPKEE